MRLAARLVIFAWLCLLSHAKLAVVRAFASAKEVAEMPQIFQIWDTVPPCPAAPRVEVDVMLVYSQSFEANPAALQATQNVISSFESTSPPVWRQCFSQLRRFDAKLSTKEDVYDARGYAARNDWANGPNSVFLYVMRSFKDGTFGTYDAFFFMEFDAVPVRSNWLSQFIAEAYDASGPAIRGSRYRGDTWDPYLSKLPADLLFHVNGNAIYNLTHPWLNSMVQRLDTELQAGTLSSAFDVRMAQLTLDAYPNAADPAIPYKADSALIGNYAQTLLNSSFESPEFVRHAALSNFFEDMPDEDITLGVLANAEMSTFLASLVSTHPFRRVVVAGDGTYLAQPQVIATPRGQTVVSSITLRASWVSSYCDIAEAVTTPFVAFTDALSVVQAPVYVLVDAQGVPLLPYIPADSEYCTTLASCTSELEEAEQLFGVKLNYHHNTFETIYNTSQFLRFCSAFRLAVSDLGSYDQCGIVNGVTGDSFIAWLISMSATEPFNYVPKNKQRYGARTWDRLHATHPVDRRTCSVYTAAELDLIGGNISTWSCLLIIEDPVRCQATPGCSWRSMFASGRCVNTPQVSFDFLSIPDTPTTSTTTMSSTGTSVTATSTTITSTTRSTVTLTVEVPCDSATLPSGFESVSCNGLFGGQSCVVECLPPLFGSSEYFCDEEGVFQGVEPTCVTRTCSFAEAVPEFYPSSSCQNVTAGGVCFLGCPEGYQGLDTIFFCGPDWLLRGILPECTRIECYTGSLPLSDGADVTDCLSGPDGRPLGAGQSCQVSCNRGFTGTTETMNCLESGLFSGTAVSCERKQCAVTWTDESIGLDCRTGTTGAAVHGDVCVAFCVQGFVGSSTEMSCVDGNFQGSLPICEPVICSWQGFQLASNVDNTACNGIATQQTCTLSCYEGYTPSGNSQVTCQTNNFFSEPQLTCQPVSCGDLSSVSGFDANVVGHTCSGATYGEICSTFCLEGYELQGTAPSVLCGAPLATNGGFTAADGAAAQPPTCNPLPCTGGFPTVRGASHTCAGVRTGESCVVTAAPGYTALPTSSTLQCQSDGLITGSLPTITAATCAAASFATGVGSTCQNKAVGAECWAYCETNYNGDARRYFCQAGGSGPELVPESATIACAPLRRLDGTADPGRRLVSLSGCDANSVQAFGLNDQQYTHSCNTLSHDDVCISHCSLGWELQGSPSVLVCDTGSLVGSPLPSCAPVACNFAWPGPQVVHDCTGKLTLETCQGACPAGYTGSAASFTCTASGNFQGNDPTCSPLTCNPPSLASQFTHDCTGITLGKKCTVQCAEGFQLDGAPGRLECGVDGSFTGDMPTCNRIQCANTVPSDPAFAKTPCDNMNFEDQCQVTCYPNFQPNTTTLTCNSVGALVGTLPLCRATPCDGSNVQRPELLNTCDGVVVGQSCSVFCARGYEAAQGAGLEELACAMSGDQATLQGAIPSCSASPCLEGLPLPSQRATNNCTQLVYQDTCVEQCIEGFTGTTPIFRCGSDGTAARDGDSFCRPEQCDSSVIGNLLAHTCADVTFGENCYAYCPPGFEADDLATRLQCLGPSSNLPAVDPSQAQAVTLRGALPQCIASQCIYNIPWEERYVHNCSAAVTGRHCLVSCAEGFVGTTEVLVCQATGDLSGSYPTCQTTTRTTTRTSTTTTKEPVLVTAYGGYLVSWTLQNATEEHPVVEQTVEQSLLGLLNGSVSFPVEATAIAVEINGTENAADILFDLRLFTQDSLAAIDDLAQVFRAPEHAWQVQAALRSLDFLSNASILEFRITLSVEAENLTVDLAYAIPPPFAADEPSDFPTEEVLAGSIGGVLILCLCCSGIIYYIRFQRAGLRFPAPDSWSAERSGEGESSGIIPDSKAKIPGSEVALRRPSVEVQEVPNLSIQPMILDQTKSPKPVDQEMEGFREDLGDLGINFESEDEDAEGSDNGLLWLEVDDMLTGEEQKELEDAGVVFQKGKRRDDDDELFESESEEEQPPVRLDVMDNTQHPPRIMTTSDRKELQDAGVKFETEASGVSSRPGQHRALRDAGIIFDTEAISVISESSDHFGL